MDKYPESISKANKQKIELGFSPINDKQFREHFPQFNIKELNNDTLIHHHIGAVVKLLQYHQNYILGQVAYKMLKKKQEFGVVIANMLNY